MIKRLLLFGATGDLAGRFLLPALADLFAEKIVPEDFRVVGAATRDLDDEEFRKDAAKRLQEHTAADVPASAREAVVQSLRYRKIDFGNVASVRAAVEQTDGGPIAAYLALPTGVFSAALKALAAIGLPQGSRIVLEKPFGEDLESAIALNKLLKEVTGTAGEQVIFRVDHALGLATVQNLLALRFANRVLQPVWNSNHIEQVDILWDETLALEGRASYYDRAGALKDVIQNHLLQILGVIAMEPPSSMRGEDLRNAKFDALRSVRVMTPEQAASRSRRARYTAGRLANSGGADGRAVPAYLEEKGVDLKRNTETFAEILLEIDNPRWSGTRFLLRTGKALSQRRKEAVLRFRRLDGQLSDSISPNELRIGLDGPHGVALHLTGINTGPPPHLAPLVLEAELPAPKLPAYSRVLMDVLSGASALSVRGDEAEQQWRIVTPVLEAWADDRVPMQEYRAGSDGPPSLAKP